MVASATFYILGEHTRSLRRLYKGTKFKPSRAHSRKDMELAYRWFLGGLAAIGLVLLLVLGLLHDGTLTWTWQLCGKGGPCTSVSPEQFVERIFAGMALMIAFGVGGALAISRWYRTHPPK
jgi:hypothetical protein